MKRFTELFLVALLAVGLSLGVMFAHSAFYTLASGPVKNSGYLGGYFQQVRGAAMLPAAAGTAAVGALATVTGIEAGDVVVSVLNLGANAGTISSANLADVTEHYTAAISTDDKMALADSAAGTPTAADNLLVLYYDLSNTR